VNIRFTVFLPSDVFVATPRIGRRGRGMRAGETLVEHHLRLRNPIRFSLANSGYNSLWW
jgi:hypothetical protein